MTESKGTSTERKWDNKKKLNTLIGYSIMDGTKEAMEDLTYGSTPLHQVKKALLVTDDLQLHRADGDVWEATAAFAFQYGMERLPQRVTGQEESDKYFKEYPRLKHADDKTGMLVEWK